MKKNKMITAITSKVVRNHLPLFYSSTAMVIGSGIAAVFMYQKEDVDENIKNPNMVFYPDLLKNCLTRLYKLNYKLKN